MLIRDQRIYQRRIQNFTREEFQGWCNRLFNEIHGADYEATTPHGNDGDLKVDGRIPKKGEYFACYSPDKYRDSSVCTKVMEDFRGLKKNWLDKGYPIKIWHFVMPHDIHPGAAQAIFDKLQEEHNTLVDDAKKKIEFKPYTLTHLMGLLKNLNEHQQSYIFGDIDDYVRSIEDEFRRIDDPKAAIECIRLTYNREARLQLPLGTDVWNRRLNVIPSVFQINGENIPFLLNKNNADFILHTGDSPIINKEILMSFLVKEANRRENPIIKSTFDNDFVAFLENNRYSRHLRVYSTGKLNGSRYNPIVEVW